MSFLDFFWLIVISFAFIAYLLVLFQIIGDLFRDRELSGWWKAVWIIFLFVLPFLSALVYLIARGRGMAQRQIAAVEQAKSETNDYIRSVASASPADQIAQAKQLLDSGAISEAEFQVLKAKALN
ncbi:phospholipase D-like protein [Sediminihabitans luteus]|uniref:Phospholipase D-like protein n=1 Tax=Sediminihabitans luteus TaxID=1138585 RepID=A0A2M9CD31_9CELL|nr:SHOCT domain-containing protein [Sediminihabitans luteus]PJJ69223.1 phospholipase D-like protein [Sediminihabitans luteus]GII98899.1 membrane protein [Sediminihabitans luteus]